MSGRDLRTFLLGHRAGTFNFMKDRGLAQKYSTGGVALGGRGLQKVDYNQLIAKAKDHRATADVQADKLKSLSKQRQESKGAWLLRLHQQMWQHEWEGLVSEVVKMEGEMGEWRASNLEAATAEGCGLMSEVTEYMADLYRDRRRFEQDTLSSLRQLQVDIKCWLKSVQSATQRETSHKTLQERLALVKEQQLDVQQNLRAEYDILWCEVEAIDTALSGTGHAETKRGVPDSIKELHCPDKAFKTSLMAEFDHLRDHFDVILDQLSQRHSSALSLSYGGWPLEDAERFAHIIEQYPASLMGRRRRAYLDRLAREFPHYTRQQLVAHETWYFSVIHYSRQKAAYLRDWQAQYRGLEVRVQAALEDYTHEVALKEAGQVTKDTQQALCQHLHEKVSKWREEKEQSLIAQAKQEAALLLEQQALREKEEKKRKKKQEQTKLQLQVYHDEQETLRAEEEACWERMREEREGVKREEAVRGQKRVKYRREQLLNKWTQRKEVLEQKMKEEREKEERLAALRQQVKVNVTSDPDRVHQETLSVQARVHFDPELPAQHPLFTTYGFSASKVTSDPRVRLEEALRQAGLHESEYARHVMRAVKPPTVPRPDQQSSLFHQNN